MRLSLIALLLALLAAAALTLLNRGLTLTAPLRWPIEVAGFAFAAGVVFWLRRAALETVPASTTARAALLGLGAVTAGWLLQQGTVALNHHTGAAAAETVTAVVADLVASGRWITPAGCAVVLEPWRAGAAPVSLELAGGDLVRDASGAIAACRTAEGSALRRGERVAVRTRRGGLGLEYLSADAGHALLVPPCNTCGKH